MTTWTKVQSLLGDIQRRKHDIALGSPSDYVVVDGIAHHACDNHHYGDMTVVRDCCVYAWIDAKEMRDKYASTVDHPAWVLEIAMWNRLTDAELEIIK